MDEQETAQFLHDLDRDIRLAEAEVQRMKDQREAFTNELADKLGPGGAVFVNDGATIAYVANGSRLVDKAAIDRLVAEHEEGVPSALIPREETVTKYPGTAALDKAAAVLSAMGVSVDDLVTYKGGRRYTIAFREREA